jgi:hypothetical protein
MRSADMSSTRAITDALVRLMAPLHDTWMREAERALEPMTRREAGFWERWAAVNYLETRFLDRVKLDSAFLSELHLERNAELTRQLTTRLQSLLSLHREVQSLSRQCPSTRQMAGAIRRLLEALRLWHGEIELAAGRIAGEEMSVTRACEAHPPRAARRGPLREPEARSVPASRGSPR